jgi:hypothetical protein
MLLCSGSIEFPYLLYAIHSPLWVSLLVSNTQCVFLQICKYPSKVIIKPKKYF